MCSSDLSSTEITWIPHPNTVFYSDPSIPNFILSWRGSPNPANKVVVLFTDERGQSYMTPEITNDILLKLIGGVQDLSIFTFTPLSIANKKYWDGTYLGWENLCQVGNGQWFELTNDTDQLFNDLMQIIDNTVCE